MTDLFLLFRASSQVRAEIGNAVLEDTPAPKSAQDVIKIQGEIKRRVNKKYDIMETIILMDWKEMHDETKEIQSRTC